MAHNTESLYVENGADMPKPPYIGKAYTRPNADDLA